MDEMDTELDYDVMDLAEDDLEYETEDDIVDADESADAWESDDNYETDSDYGYEEQAEVDDTLMSMINADEMDGDENADFLIPFAIKKAIDRRKKAKRAKEARRQKALRKMVKQPKSNRMLGLSNRRTIAAIRRQVSKNTARSVANSRTNRGFKRALSVNSKRITKVDAAAARANTVNKLQARQIRRARKVQRIDGALDFARSISLERTDNGLDISLDLLSALQGAVKQEWLGKGRGFLANPGTLGALGFLVNNLGEFVGVGRGNGGLIQVNP